MKRFGTFVLSFSSLFFLFPTLVFAQCPPGYDNLCKVGPDSNPKLFGNIVQFLIVIAIVIAVIFVIWGGIKWITSGGDKGKVEEARATVTGAVIGLLIAFLAYGIVSYIVYTITGQSGLNFNIPRLID